MTTVQVTHHDALPTRRTVMLASPRSTYLVGPVSGLQLAAALAAVILPIFIAISGVAGWGFLIVLIWQITLVSALRRNGLNGWQLLARVWIDAKRSNVAQQEYCAPSDTATWDTHPLPIPRELGNSRQLFAHAPGRLARATIVHSDAGDLVCLPRPGGQTKPGRVTAAWHVTGPAYSLLPVQDQDTAIEGWAACINRLSLIPGLVGISLNSHADSATGMGAALSWHYANARDAAVPVARRNYEELLNTVDARHPSSVLSVTFDPRKVAGKIAGITRIVAEIPLTLQHAGITVDRQLTVDDYLESVLDTSRPIDEISMAAAIPGSKPTFPAYTDSKAHMSFPGVHHAIVVATTATSVGVNGDVLAPVFAARPGVETSVAITVRPLPTEQTQARARARQVKLRRQRAAAESSSMSGLLIDTHRLDQEIATLHALGADAARGSVETELAIHVCVSGPTTEAVDTARTALVRDAAPLRFVPIAYPTPSVIFTRAPLGGLL